MGIDPGTLAIASMVASGIGAAASAYGAYQQGQARSADANYQAQVARMNQQIADQNSRYETERGQQMAGQQGLKNRAVLAAEVAAQGANGLDINSGSNLRVRTSGEEIGQQDVQTITTDAARQSWNYKAQASNASAQSNLLSMQAGQESEAGYFQAGTSLLSGASSIGNQYLTYSKLYGVNF